MFQKKTVLTLVAAVTVSTILAGCGSPSAKSGGPAASTAPSTATEGPTNLKWPVSDFKAIDQNGQSVTLADLKGKVWIADVFYSSCPTVCPPIADNMAHLQKMLKDKGIPVEIVSFSVDPQYETPKSLKIFGQEHGADFSNWHFLAGYSFDWIKQFAQDTLKTTVAQVPNSRIFSHPVNWYVVNQSGVIETFYDGLHPYYNEIVKTVQSLEAKR